MVNEHYVPQSYLRQFAPDGEGLVSRYSLIDSHGGGDYYSSPRYSIDNAASERGFADGIFEKDEATQAENNVISIFQRLTNGKPLTESQCGDLSQFVAFQFERTPKQQLFYQSQNFLSDQIDEFDSDGWISEVEDSTAKGYKALQHFGWIFLENNSEVPMITSDHPVVSYREDDLSEKTISGVQIFYPINPNHLIVLLHPNRFDVQPMYPDAHIEKMSIQKPVEAHKFNLLQPLSAFEEIFGPVNENDYLESLVERLISKYPDEDFVRGPQCDRETLEMVHRIATEQYQKYKNTRWYQENIKPIILAEEKKATSINHYNHGLKIIEELRSG